jgi:hypothetical protein
MPCFNALQMTPSIGARHFLSSTRLRLPVRFLPGCETCVFVLTDTCFMFKEEKKGAEERRKREDKTHSAIRQAENQTIVDKTRNLISPSQSL